LLSKTAEKNTKKRGFATGEMRFWLLSSLSLAKITSPIGPDHPFIRSNLQRIPLGIGGKIEKGPGIVKYALSRSNIVKGSSAS